MPEIFRECEASIRMMENCPMTGQSNQFSVNKYESINQCQMLKRN